MTFSDPVVDLRSCPFCGAQTTAQTCTGCGRDITGARKACGRCGKMTPMKEKQCSHCGAGQVSEMSWKIPLIIALIVLGIVLSVLVESMR